MSRLKGNLSYNYGNRKNMWEVLGKGKTHKFKDIKYIFYCLKKENWLGAIKVAKKTGLKLYFNKEFNIWYIAIDLWKGAARRLTLDGVPIYILNLGDGSIKNLYHKIS